MYLTIEEVERKLYIENSPFHKVFVEKLDELEDIDQEQLKFSYDAGFVDGQLEGRKEGYDEGYQDCLDGK